MDIWVFSLNCMRFLSNQAENYAILLVSMRELVMNVKHLASFHFKDRVF